MEILPSEYKSIELTKYEKIFTKAAENTKAFGYLLLNCNPAGIPGFQTHILLTADGVLFLKFMECADEAQFLAFETAAEQAYYPMSAPVIASRLLNNKALSVDKKQLKFPANIVFCFPNITQLQANSVLITEESKRFVEEHCLFEDNFLAFRQNVVETAKDYLAASICPLADERMAIQPNNLDSIVQRLAPQYEIVRAEEIHDGNYTAGADEELLIVDERDRAVRAFRLDKDQINLVNKIHKGEQLILACAGSGKSVLLIAKCFRAAELNPDKKFLITCYSRNLANLYNWYIDMAGFRDKNVQCITFHMLCESMLKEAGLYTPPRTNMKLWGESVTENAIKAMNAGKISRRYYGIFIDEVQAFNLEWYKLAYNLLENKDTEEHLFVICGDKTQDITKKSKHGRAPWQAGEGYPVYRGNKSIRMDINYRNCIEINDFINRYVTNSRAYWHEVNPDAELDPEMFLRGRAMSHGVGVTVKQLPVQSNACEVATVMESIQQIHDINKIPYDEIAVIMYNARYNYHIPGWQGRFDVEEPLLRQMRDEGIPHVILYSTQGLIPGNVGSSSGVRMVKFETSLGLDFRAVIVCGLKPLGYHEGSKNPGKVFTEKNEEKHAALQEDTLDSIRDLYVACTRAKDVLHVIAPEGPEQSVYMKLIKDSVESVDNK